MLVIINTPCLGSSQGESNHHANAEIIDKAGVLVLDKGSVPENLAGSGRNFHSLEDCSP
jgi:hypothetical protein